MRTTKLDFDKRSRNCQKSQSSYLKGDEKDLNGVGESYDNAFFRLFS